MTQRLPYERDEDGVVTLRLQPIDGPLVVLNRALISAIDASLDAIQEEYGNQISGFVLASEGRVFVAGADLKEIMGLSDEELHEYLKEGQRVYGRIATLPVTTVAAINGAALGGGLEIAMHCDHLVAAQPTDKPYQIGLPEAGLHITPGWGGTNMLPARMDPVEAIMMTAEGRTVSVTDAAEAGVIGELVPLDDLHTKAAELARRPKLHPPTSPRNISDEDAKPHARAAINLVLNRLPDTKVARMVLRCVETGLNKGWRAALDEERESLVTLRNSDEAQKAIRAFFDKTAAKKG